MRRVLNALAVDTRGATLIEYALIIALVFLVIVASVTAVADATIDMWDNVQEAQSESNQ